MTHTASAQGEANRSIETVPAPAPEHPAKRMFGIIPSNNTWATLTTYKPLTTGEKFKLASADAFDYGTLILALGFGAKGMATDANPSFGQGVKGYAHYFVTSYADWALGDYMTEAVVPTLTHQDPRYFRKGSGGGLKRLLYAMSQSFWTHTDSGGHFFNISEVGGNAAAVAVAQAYYPDNRTAGSAATQFAVQIGMDMASNIVKEFYPEMIGIISKKHTTQSALPPSK